MIYLISTKKVGSSFSKEMVSHSIKNLFGAKEPNLMKTNLIKKMIRIKMIKIMKQKKKEKKELKVIQTLFLA